MLGRNAFGMELHAMDGLGLVLQAHDDAVLRLGGDFEAFRQALALDDERMIARRREAVRHRREDALRAMPDLGHLAMHQLRRPDHLAAKGLADRLVTEADAEYGHLILRLVDELEADAGL